MRSAYRRPRGFPGSEKEMALAFVESCAKVCVCDIDVTALDTAAKEIPGLTTNVCHVSKRQDIERMVAAAVDELGRLDVLVNNAAGIWPTIWFTAGLIQQKPAE